MGNKRNLSLSEYGNPDIVKRFHANFKTFNAFCLAYISVNFYNKIPSGAGCELEARYTRPVLNPFMGDTS